MNRTERLYALVDALRRRAPRTWRAAELAERFGVSTRTIERDLIALGEAGVPIWAQPGPGGGYGIHADMTLPPLNFTAAEAAAVATALTATGAMPFSEAGRSALDKLAAAMAEAPRDAAAELTARIRVVPGPDGPDSVAGAIEPALSRAVAVELIYQDRAGWETSRIVEPGGVVGTQRGWYLAAWCRLRRAPRMFRLDRIVAVGILDEPVTPRPLETLLPDFPFDVVEPALS